MDKNVKLEKNFGGVGVRNILYRATAREGGYTLYKTASALQTTAAMMSESEPATANGAGADRPLEVAAEVRARGAHFPRRTYLNCSVTPQKPQMPSLLIHPTFIETHDRESTDSKASWLTEPSRSA